MNLNQIVVNILNEEETHNKNNSLVGGFALNTGKFASPNVGTSAGKVHNQPQSNKVVAPEPKQIDSHVNRHKSFRRNGNEDIGDTKNQASKSRGSNKGLGHHHPSKGGRAGSKFGGRVNSRAAKNSKGKFNKSN